MSLILLILVTTCSSSWAVVQGGDGSCYYTWYSMKDGQCKCGSELGGRLRCNDVNKTVDIGAGFCVTYDPIQYFKGSSIVIASCPYGILPTTTDRKFNSLPCDPTLVNSSQCSPYNRKGLFCGKCLEGFGPAVYSFDLHCANCSHYSTASAITLYITLECLPITVFYLVVLICRPKLLTGPQLGYVMFCQCIYNTVWYSRYIYRSLALKIPKLLAVVGKIGFWLDGVWNMKFFQIFVPPFCISERLSGIHIQILGFIIPLFPLLLVIVTYISIEFNSWYGCIHSRRYILNKSVIHAFATFTILSIYLTIVQTYAILQTSYVLDNKGSIVGKVLEVDPGIQLFGVEHIPYLVSTLTLSFVMAVTPGVILCIYPTPIYRKLISPCLHPRRQLAVKIFVETVNSGFKDGLNGTRDHRMIPGAMILLGVLFAILMSLIPHRGFGGFPPLFTGIVFISIAFTVSIAQPCKDTATNISLSLHLLILGILSILSVLWWQDLLLKSDILASCIICLTVIPHSVMLFWVFYKTVKMLNFSRCVTLCDGFRYTVSGWYCKGRERFVVLKHMAIGREDLLESNPLLYQ